MAGSILASFQNSPPSFQASAESGARSDSGSIYGSFTSGDFSVGGNKSINWLFVIVGIVFVVFFLFKGKRK